MASPRILALAQEAQRKHAALLQEASVRTSREARLQIADSLNAVRREFRTTALGALGISLPLDPAGINADDVNLVEMVSQDIADSAKRLRDLRDQEQLSKTVRQVSEGPFSNVKLPTVKLGDVPWYVWLGVGLVVLLAFRSR